MRSAWVASTLPTAKRVVDNGAYARMNARMRGEHTAKVAPSILAADFAALGDAVRAVDQAGADWIHVDVMDGRFVPPITIGADVVKALRSHSEKPFDVHLMIVEPERHIDAFAAAGANVITVHAEACVHLQRTLSQIRALGARAGVSLNPHTPEHVLDYVLEDIDLVLVMSVNPGFGGQKFLSSVLPKIEALRRRIDKQGLEVDIEVDGGVNPDNAVRIRQAGANVLVAGTAVFGAADMRDAISQLKGASR